jgi:hypothetical protein
LEWCGTQWSTEKLCPRFSIANSGYAATSPFIPTVNEWHSYGGASSLSGTFLSIDGVVVASQVNSFSGALQSTFYLGGTSTQESSLLNTKMTLLYARSLSAQEIQSLHESPYQMVEGRPTQFFPKSRLIDPTKNSFRWY